jgi:outer membrane protein assembly factor BamA
MFAAIPIVSGIDIVGQKVTKEYIIRREVQHPLDVPLDSLIALEDRNRIDNLGIFAEVGWRTIPQLDGSVRVEYNVTESWPRIVPAPYPAYDEKLGWSYGMLVVIRNFQGRNQNLLAGGQIGAQDLYGVFFSDPWITGDHVSLSVNAGKAYFGHSYRYYDIESTSLRMIFGRYFGYNHKMSAGFELEKKSFLGVTDTLDLNYIAPEFNYTYDTRDVYLSPTKGVRMNQNLLTMFDFGSGGNRAFWTQSYSMYKALIGGARNLVLAINASGRFSIGDRKEVYQVYIGTSSTIRGWRPVTRTLFKNGEQPYRFGHHWVTSSFELRQILIPKFVTRWKTEFGLAVVGFVDVGFASDGLSSLFDDSAMLGTGAGVRVNWPWAGMFRLDYGLGIYGGEQIDRYLNFSVAQKF